MVNISDCVFFFFFTKARSRCMVNFDHPVYGILYVEQSGGDYRVVNSVPSGVVQYI